MAIDTEKFRARLQTERDKAKAEILGRTELPETFTDDGALDSGDRSVQEVAMDVEGQLMNLRSDHLQSINAALQRIDRGDYGICTRCGNEIAERRLEAEPTALTCIDCQSAAEREFTAPTM
jgi:DnaK suppressor protein